MALRYQDIFVPGGFPLHTYNPRTELQLEQKLSEAKDNLCKLVAVTGHTKSGKTVLANKVFPREEAIWVDGGLVSTEDDLWQIVLEQLDLFQSTQTTGSTESTAKLGGKATAGANFLIAKGEGEISTEIEKSRGSSTSMGRTLSSRVVAARGLREAKIPLIIDDFHYIPLDVQGGIIRALKPLIFEGVPALIIAIPHRRYDAMKVEKEMTGRISQVEIKAWSEEELAFIPNTGFHLLNYGINPNLSRTLAIESIGSPHLMQDFCRGICGLLDIKAAAPPAELGLTGEQLKAVFSEVADTIGRPIFEKLARGPRQRSDRLPRELRDGRTVDIYELVLHGLAHIRPELVSVEYEDLRAAIKEVSSGQIPQLHEVARVLRHMSTIAATDQSSTPVIEFDEEEKKLHVTDPFFAFYLRWGELAIRSLGPPAQQTELKLLPSSNDQKPS